MNQRRLDACEEVDSIRVDGGGVTPDDIEYLKRERPKLLRTVLSLQKQLAGSAKFLAEQLNTKDTRFVYELIQNAEDNKYPDGVEPFLIFTLQKDRVIIDSNEVGFSTKNIAAISKIGQSTKGRKIGFIGEKGVGFKSVFRIARKVHIQSEPYSFAFIYDKGDSGLGMVTPLNEDYLQIPDGVQTRMTLHFRDDCNRTQLREDFLQLPATLLLFLKKLKRMTLNIEVPEHPDQHITYFLKSTDELGTRSRVTIRKDDGGAVSTYNFWVKKQQVYDMPTDPARENISEAEVVLAFPLDVDEAPVIESQWICAYLPMRKENFQFLIQSDFITGANREDIRECEWNDRLRRAVAEVFVRAVQGKGGLLDHPTLRYSWVRYITTTSIAHDYWGKLQRLIVNIVKAQKLFLSQEVNSNETDEEDDKEDEEEDDKEDEEEDDKEDEEEDDKEDDEEDKEEDDKEDEEDDDKEDDEEDGKEGDEYDDEEDDEVDDEDDYEKEIKRWHPEQLRIVPSDYRDDEGNPLLTDLIQGKTAYISEEYDPRLDIPILRKLGTISLCMSPDFLDRLDQDLDLDKGSSWRSTEFSSDWYTNISRLLLEAIKDSTKKEAVQRLKIIPLKNSTWVSSLHASIFFPTSGGIDVPEGLKLSLLDSKALTNGTFKTLLLDLGISECKPGQVIPLIEQRYGSSDTCSTDTLLQDMKFLFWHHEEVPTSAYNIYMSCNDGTGYFWGNVAVGGWVYCPESDRPYSMYKLLDGTIPNELKGKIKFPRIQYFDVLRNLGSRYDKTGPDWLMSRAGIMITPQLCCRTRPSSRGHKQVEMSPELLYICENLPQYLLGVLENDWTNYHKSKEWDDTIMSTKVPILDAQKERELRITFLPLPSLKRIANELDLSEEFGFLEELDDMTETDSVRWHFLERFGVGTKEDLGFWFALLRKAQKKENIKKEKVFQIYRHLQKFVDMEEVVAIRDAFKKLDLVYVPISTSPETWGWTYVKYCVWKAPHWFSYFTSLNNLTDYKSLYALFVHTLQVGDITIEYCLDYLEKIKERGDYGDDREEEAKISLLYSKFSELTEADENAKVAKDNIRSRMEKEELVYDPAKGLWHSPANCVWAEDRIQLPGKFSLATTYKGHASFFRDVLGVKKPDLAMHIVALIEKSSDNQDKESILQEMRNICALNPKADVLQAKLKECACFPVRKPSGELEWLSSTDRFAIVDRTGYGKMFRDKVKTLDFSLEEVHSVRVLLRGLNLETKYLSNAAKEETRVEDPVADLLLTENLRNKAYAITRYAAHFGASDPTKIFSLLEQLEVFTSDKIFRTVSVFQKQETDKAFFHIEKVDDHLKLYVPHNLEHQQVCLFRHLPLNLLGYLGVQVHGKGAELGGIITASSLFVVDTILEQDGVINIPSIVRPEDARNGSTASPPTSSVDSVTTTSMIRSSSRLDTVSQIEDTAYANDNSWMPPRSGSYASPDTAGLAEQLELFKKLINFAIQQANYIDALPRVGTYIEASQNSEDFFNHHLAIQSHRHIGAVGELFVFQLLNNLSLPGFNKNCWRSTIRHLIALHDRFSDVTQWIGFETADIVYADSESKLTDLLIRSGYLARNSWHGHTPTYYMEVKTTMGNLDQPFFCNQKQFDMMEKMELPDSDQSADAVYLIARVFGLGQSRMGLKLYLDPWKLRRTEQLKFKAEVYSITPSG